MAGKLGRLTGRSSDYWLRQSFPFGTKATRSTASSNEFERSRPFNSGLLVNHQIIAAVKKGIIFIEPFTLANVQVAAIHLTLCEITADGKRFDLGGNKHFLLKPGCCVNVTTKERVALPLDYAGRLAVPMQLASIGMVSSLGFQVEPGYDGHLRFYMFNAGATSFRMGAGELVASLEIMRLGTIPSQIIPR